MPPTPNIRSGHVCRGERPGLSPLSVGRGGVPTLVPNPGESETCSSEEKEALPGGVKAERKAVAAGGVWARRPRHGEGSCVWANHSFWAACGESGGPAEEKVRSPVPQQTSKTGAPGPDCPKDRQNNALQIIHIFLYSFLVFYFIFCLQPRTFFFHCF